MKNLIEKLDPYRQSFLYFDWGFWSILCCLSAIIWLGAHYDGNLAENMLNNVFVYLPNYLTHEFSHRFWCHFNWEWWCYASGNGMETLIPLILCFVVLRIRGGRYLLPLLLYWLGTTFYGAGIYAADARAMKLPLTSSDMMSNFAPGQMKGDWWYILNPLGLLDYDVIIGRILIYGGIVCLVLAVYSLWYYWSHTDQYISNGRWN